MMPGTGCALTCPGPLNTPSEYDTMMRIAWILSTLGTVAGIYMLLTYTIFEKKRKQLLTLSLIFKSFVLSAIFTVQAITYPQMEDRFCLDPTTPYDQHDVGLCVVQGVAIGYFPFSIVCWWLCLAFDIRLKSIKQRKNIGHYYKYYFIFSTFLPLLVNVIPRLMWGVVGYKIGSPFCNNASQISSIRYWGTLYIPIAICIVFGLVIMGLLLHAMFKSVVNSKTGTSSGTMKRFLRPILFIIVFMLKMMTGLSLAAYAQFHEDEYKKSLMDWMAYSFSNFNGVAGSVSDACGVAPSVRFPIAAWIIYICSIYGQTLYTFVVFVSAGEDVKLWKKFFNRKSKVSAPKSRHMSQPPII